jgi:hypothetical protein
VIEARSLKEESMARKVVETVVSDLSGQTIKEGDIWTMELTPEDGRKNKFRLDLSETEAMEFAAKGTEIKRRGRPPGSRNKAKP